MSRVRLHLTLLAAMALAGCTRNPAPSGWLAPAENALSDRFGAWVAVSRGDSAELGGELLAAGTDSVYVLTSDSVVHAIAIDGIANARLAFYDSRWGTLATWNALAILGTVSNGFYLILTLPITGIGGSLATANQSRAPILRIDERGGWELARKYARFPAGVPENLPRVLPPKRTESRP